MIDRRARFERAFEAFDMPEPAFERMLGRRERRRAAQRSAVFALAAVLTTATVAILVSSFGSGQLTGGHPTSTLNPRNQVLGIVIPETDEPAGLTFLSNSAGVSAVTRPLQGSSIEANRAVQRGFVDAYVNEFAGPENTLIGSFAAIYEDEASAAAALRVFRTAFANDYDYRDPPTDPELGDEGFAFAETSIPPTYTYVWRRGNVLLNVHAYGRIEADDVRQVAETMDARARQEEGA